MAKDESLLDFDVPSVLEKIESKYNITLPRHVVSLDYGEDVGDLHIKFKHSAQTEGEPTQDGQAIIFYDNHEIAAIEITDITTIIQPLPTLEKIKQIITEHKSELQTKYKVKTIGIFGSYVRGEQTRQSDLDVVVEVEEGTTLFDLVDIENYLTEIIGVKVDVGLKKALKPHVGKRILEEVVML